MHQIPSKCPNCGEVITFTSLKNMHCQYCGGSILAAAVAQRGSRAKGMDYGIEGKVLWEYNGEDRQVQIPSNVVRIESSAFENSLITDVMIPDSVKSIFPRAFYNCKFLKSIYISNSVTSIEEETFADCTSLKSVKIPDSVTVIEDYAFRGCTSLKSINIPDSVTKIGVAAFRGCKSLESVNIPDSLTEIYIGDFEGCTSLKSINIPDSVTKIYSSAFRGCKSLESINIPDSVTGIDSSAFEGCTSLKSIYIPDSVTELGYSVFKGCSSLVNVQCKCLRNIEKKMSHSGYSITEVERTREYFHSMLSGTPFYAAWCRTHRRCAYCGGPVEGMIKRVCVRCKEPQE